MSAPRIRAAWAAILLLMAAAAPAPAGDFNLPPLTAAELDATRGGFILPTGIEIDFGAVARTYFDGSLILETHISWGADGSPTEETLTGPDLVAIDDLVNGFALQDEAGSTILAHQIDDAGVRNILLNDASGRDLRTETQLTVTLPGFEASQAAIRESILAVRLWDDLNAAP